MTPKTYRCDILDVPGADNVRDIGGYIGRGGKAVNKGRFLRAGRLSGLTAAGVAAIRAAGVNCIVDLRSTFEVAQQPDTLAGDKEIAYVHVPMLDYIQSHIAEGITYGFPSSMAEMYIGLLDNDQADLLRALRAYADPAHHTVLFHCTAGKDRTGLSAMLLLGLAGVSRADIVEDYSHSEELMSLPNSIDHLPHYLFESKPATIEAAMDHLDKCFGGIAPYLTHIGVDDAMADRLLEKLLK